MDDSGFSEDHVLSELSSFSKKDTNFKKVMSSMCTVPHSIAIKAHDMFLFSNSGDPGLFEGTDELEKKVIRNCAEMLCHPEPYEAFGHMTSGGTESNFEAVYHMKYLKQQRMLPMTEMDPVDSIDPVQKSEKNGRSRLNCSRLNRSRLNCPRLNLVVSSSAHFSFSKIEKLLDLEIRKADVDPFFRVVPSSVRALIDENTVGIIGIAGSTEFGYPDPIGELAEIAVSYDLPLHVDAAFGGFVFPFLPEQASPAFRALFKENADLFAGLDLRFDFRLPGVTSVALDPHKMGLSTIPSGVIVYRNENAHKGLDVLTHYLTNPIQSTVLSTRTGTSAAATYAVMRHLGRDGYSKNVRYCLDLKGHFLEKAKEAGFSPSVPPFLNIVTLPFKDHETVSVIRRRMKEKYGWHISASRQIPALRFVLMPHVSFEDIDRMFEDLVCLLDDI